MQNVNPGLSRRFAIEDAFHFDDFNNSELREILNLKLKKQDLSATDTAKSVAIEVLDRARNRPNFGNAGRSKISLAKQKAAICRGRHRCLFIKDRWTSCSNHKTLTPNTIVTPMRQQTSRSFLRMSSGARIS